MNSPRRSLCAMVLCVEAIVLGLTTPVMIAVADVSTGTALAVGLGLAVGCVVVAGLLRAEWAYWLGHLIQVAAVGLGFVVPLMFVLGPVLAALWAAAFAVGRRIESDRAGYAAPAENGAAHGPDPGD